MQRRNLLKALAATSLAGVAPGAISSASAAVLGKTATHASATLSHLDQGRWAAFNYQQVETMLAQVGVASKGYNPHKKPYAVFDWDNTAIMNDCEEALLIYQIDHLAYKLTPDEFARVVRTDVPNGAFINDYANAEGKPVKMEDIAADVEADYRWLYANYVGFGGKLSLEAIHETNEFKSFRAKLYFMYDAICDSHPIEIGYKWIIYFYANMSKQELQKLAEASNDYNLGDALRKTKFSSPASRPGRAGVVTSSHFFGIRIHTEIASLMNTLRANGIDVYVSTASIDDVVRVFAANPKYGYNVPEENVIGLRLEMADGKYQPRYRNGWHFNWGPGKSVGIKNELVAKKGYGPVLVAGDSDGDAWMLKDFADTRVSLIVNRLKKGAIGDLSKLAAQSQGAPSARFLLQGRDEQTGMWLPEANTLKYGKLEKKLTA